MKEEKKDIKTLRSIEADIEEGYRTLQELAAKDPMVQNMLYQIEGEGAALERREKEREVEKAKEKERLKRKRIKRQR